VKNPRFRRSKAYGCLSKTRFYTVRGLSTKPKLAIISKDLTKAISVFTTKNQPSRTDITKNQPPQQFASHKDIRFSILLRNMKTTLISRALTNRRFPLWSCFGAAENFSRNRFTKKIILFGSRDILKQMPFGFHPERLPAVIMFCRRKLREKPNSKDKERRRRHTKRSSPRRRRGPKGRVVATSPGRTITTNFDRRSQNLRNIPKRQTL